MELKLNIYAKDGKTIEKTYISKDYNVSFGIIRKFMKLINIEKMEDKMEVLNLVMGAWEQFETVLSGFFPEVTEDEWDRVSLEEIVDLIIDIAMSIVSKIAKIPTQKKMTLGLTNGTINGGFGVTYDSPARDTTGVPYPGLYGQNVSTTQPNYATETPVLGSVGVTTDPTKSGMELSDSDLYLYFYVGETVQNANLIDAGRIGEQLATKTDMLQASGAGMPSNKYIDLTLGASGSTYTAPANGWVRFAYKVTSQGGWGSLVNNTNNLWTALPGNYYTGGVHSVFVPVKKGDSYTIQYGGSTGESLRFIYAEGSSPTV